MTHAVPLFTMNLSSHMLLKQVPEKDASLTEKTYATISMQQQIFTQTVEEKQTKIHPDSLCALHDKLCAMAYEDRMVFIKSMSEQVLLLTYAAVCLPQELVKHICFFLLDGDSTIIDTFYTQEPFFQALDSYNSLRSKCKDKCIGPLYAASRPIRELTCRLMEKPRYGSIRVMSSEEEELLDDTIKRIYLEGKEIKIVPHYICTLKYLSKLVALGSAVAACSFGSMLLGFTILGALFGISIQMGCHSAVVTTELFISCCCGSTGCLCNVIKDMYIRQYHAKQIIIQDTL
jgi:hypothetical protein